MNTQIIVDPQRYETMTFSKVIEFKAGLIVVRFVPEANIPGYSHKILVFSGSELLGSDWLPSDQNPTHKNAEFFYNKIVNHVYKS